MKFGDYVEIEQKRYGVENEMYLHKIIGNLKSNSYVDVPVERTAREILHSKVVDVVACICCGIVEKEVLNYRVIDVHEIYKGKSAKGELK